MITDTKHRVAVVAAIALVSPAGVFGQVNRTSMARVPYPLHSGEHGRAADTHVAVYADTISWPGTPLLRIHFATFELGEHSYITLTSRQDGNVQIMTAKGMRDSKNYSAMFNGDAVDLELFAAPGETGLFVEVDEIYVFDSPGGTPQPQQADICGATDDRVPSTDPRVGRLSWSVTAPGGCTAWLVSNGAALTAGHCGVPDGNLTGAFMEFNVPPSSANGVPTAAATQDQYPVATWAFQSNGVGADWNVFQLNPNTTTQQRAHLVQGYFHFTSRLPASDALVRVTGYGFDPFPAGPGGAGADWCDWDSDGNGNFDCNSSSQTQQSHAARFGELDGSTLEYEPDTLPANSGSPVFINALPAFAIGIHTSGGCDSVGYNAGTWFGYAPLSNALNGFLGPNFVFVDAISIAGPETGHVLDPFNSVAEAVAVVPDGGGIGMVAGSYPAASGNLFTAGADGRSMRLVAPVGTVVIGN